MPDNGIVRSDLIQDAESFEEAGEFVGCTRTFTVDVENTGRVGDAFHAAATDTRIPACGEALNDFYPYENIKVEKRRFQINGFPAVGLVRVKVICDYGLQRPPDDPLATSGDSTLNQIKITKDSAGNYIGLTVDGEFKNVPVTVLQARSGFGVDMTELTDDPETLKGTWINYVNDDHWKGGAPGEWLCARVAYRLVNRTTTPMTYVFTYEFDKKPGGHKYAPGQYDDDGYLLQEGSAIVWHPKRSFSAKFP